ncbi:MAG: tetratricopeptide repeat protein [bacterium]|nr:tetratricopeptide repeat protein [bacterium]
MMKTTSTARTVLVFLGVLGLVVVLSYAYNKYLESTAPAVETPLALSETVRDGIAALREERYGDARRLLESVAADDPEYVVARHGLSATLFAQGEHERSVEVARALTDERPQDAETWIALGWAQHRMGDHTSAEGVTLQALQLDAEHKAAHYNLALFRLAQGRLPEAIDGYYKEMERNKDVPAFSRARQDLRRLHDARADLPGVHYALAFFAKTALSRQEEIVELQHFLDLDTTGPVADQARVRLEEARAALNPDG